MSAATTLKAGSTTAGETSASATRAAETSASASPATTSRVRRLELGDRQYRLVQLELKATSASTIRAPETSASGTQVPATTRVSAAGPAAGFFNAGIANTQHRQHGQHNTGGFNLSGFNTGDWRGRHQRRLRLQPRRPQRTGVGSTGNDPTPVDSSSWQLQQRLLLAGRLPGRSASPAH